MKKDLIHHLNSRADRNPLLLALILLATIVLARNTWVDEDAYITFRTVDNFINGYGLRWNIAERVQTYTNPLWMLVMSVLYFFTREVYFTSIALSFVLTLLSLRILGSRVAVSFGSAFLCITLLIFSKSFIDFSTSGLENPMSHFLLVVFFAVFFGSFDARKKAFYLSLIAAMAALNRMDTILFYIPSLMVIAWQGRRERRVFVALVAGFIPFIAWELFSLVYYGFPFPNTAYAKISNSIGRFEFVKQGLAYFLSTLDKDPLTFFILAAAPLIVFFVRGHRSLIPLATGLILYLVYTVYVGGDYMAGRFLSAPVVCAILLLSRYKLSSPLSYVPVYAISLGLAFCGDLPTLFVNSNFSMKVGEGDNKLIIDNHAYRSPVSSLLLATRYQSLSTRSNRFWPINPWKATPIQAMTEDEIESYSRHVQIKQAIGYCGFYTPRDIHIIDTWALADPLLVRLPVVADRRDSPVCVPAWLDFRWRVGHLRRLMPDGYMETLETGVCKIKDPQIAEFNRKLWIITRGDIFSLERFLTILKMNLGRYNYLINEEKYWRSFETRTKLSSVAEEKADGTPWDAKGNLKMTSKKPIILVSLDETKFTPFLTIALDCNDSYEVAFLKKGRKVVGRQEIEASKSPSARGLMNYLVPVPLQTTREGYDQIAVYPIKGDGNYSMGHLRLLSM